VIGRAIVIALFCIGLAHAGIEDELEQQQNIEGRLQSELEMQMELSAQAYRDVVDFTEGAIINREEQIERLKAANIVWDEFIEKICRVETLESIGSRAEHANNLQCMIEKHKEKERFFKAAI
jgi:hypothetical protein